MTGSKDVGDCRGCGNLATILFCTETQELTDEQFLEYRAHRICGICSRKPEEIKRYNPADRFTQQYVFNKETGKFETKLCDAPFKDEFISMGDMHRHVSPVFRSKLQKYPQRCEDFASQVVYNKD